MVQQKNFKITMIQLSCRKSQLNIDPYGSRCATLSTAYKNFTNIVVPGVADGASTRLVYPRLLLCLKHCCSFLNCSIPVPHQLLNTTPYRNYSRKIFIKRQIINA